MTAIGPVRAWLEEVLVLGAVATFTASRLPRVWVAHDEGTFGHSADRILAGELPHRDFDAIYSGGLELLHAATFALLGRELLHLRWVLFAAWLLWLTAVLYIARAMTGDRRGALVVTALAGVLSIPQYPAAMPSWYNLFLATAVVAALLAYGRSSRPRWLFAAGLAAGLSVTFKVVGLYALAGGLLGLVLLRLQDDPAPGSRPNRGPTPGTGPGTAAALALAGVLYLLTVLALLTPVAGAPEHLHYLLPQLLLVAAILFLAWRRRSPLGLSELGRDGSAMVGGALLGVAPLVAVYAGGDALGALYRGIFVLPQARWEWAVVPLPGWPALAAGAAWPLAAGLGVIGSWREWGTAFQVTLVLAFAGSMAAVGLLASPGELAGWALTSVRVWVPALAVVSLVVVVRRRDADPRMVRAALVVVPVLAVHSLIQFPFAADWYVFYVAPLTVLAAAAFFAPWFRRVPVLGLIAVAYGGWAVMQSLNMAAGRTEPLELAGASIRVTAEDARLHRELVETVLLHAEAGDATLALPDAPEIYYLSGLRNPTRTLFDFFDQDFDMPDRRRERILSSLEEHTVDVVVVDHSATFSGPPPQGLLRALEDRYPSARRIGPFEVRW